jgi:pimeloyl-ACP methyl ester carboxylesterase
VGIARRSLFVDVDGPVHVTDFGGPAGAPVVLCVHGLRASSASWAPFAKIVTSSHRVLAVDLPGHGRTPSEGRSLSVPEGAAVLRGVARAVGNGPVTLVGHSMGAAVAVLAAAAEPSIADRLLLLAPPLPRHGLDFISRAVLPHVGLCLWPRLGRLAMQRRLERQSLDEYVWNGLRLTCASTTDLGEVAEELVVELEAAYARGEDPLGSFIRAARSIGALVAEGRRYREALAEVQAPVHVMHGVLDRVLRPTGLRQLEALGERWTSRQLPHVGHSPHLEVPDHVADLLLSLTARDDHLAGRRPARHVPATLAATVPHLRARFPQVPA